MTDLSPALGGQKVDNSPGLKSEWREYHIQVAEALGFDRDELSEAWEDLKQSFMEEVGPTLYGALDALVELTHRMGID